MTMRERVRLAVGLTVLGNVLLVLPLSMAAITFLRGRMFLYCDFARMGASDPGSFLCADGISYIAPGLVLGIFVALLFLAAALAVAIWIPRPLSAVRAAACVAIASLVFTVVASVVASGNRNPGSNIPVGVWSLVMATPSVLFSLAAVALAVTGATRSPVAIRVTLSVALGLILAATLVEPTLAFGTAPAVMAVGAALFLSSHAVFPQARSRADARGASPVSG
jgi:hypothetical protein